MRIIAWMSALAALSLGLGAETGVRAESAVPAAKRGNTSAGPSAAREEKGSGADKAASSALRRSSNGDEEQSGAAANAERSTNDGGYSWTDKRRLKKLARSTPLDPSRPLAQAPNFEMRPDGTSVVTLALSRSTEVAAVVKGLRAEYRLKNAQIGISNNMNPLITAHFATPLERVVLKRAKSDAVLVLTLREAIQPIYQLRPGTAGGSMLAITIPKATRSYAVPSAPPTMSHGDKSEPVKKTKRRPTHRSSSGPGPGL